jgi:hypothetical protein
MAGLAATTVAGVNTDPGGSVTSRLANSARSCSTRLERMTVSMGRGWRLILERAAV